MRASLGCAERLGRRAAAAIQAQGHAIGAATGKDKRRQIDSIHGEALSPKFFPQALWRFFPDEGAGHIYRIYTENGRLFVAWHKSVFRADLGVGRPPRLRRQSGGGK